MFIGQMVDLIVLERTENSLHSESALARIDPKQNLRVLLLDRHNFIETLLKFTIYFFPTPE